MLIFIKSAAEAWTTRTDPTGDVAACHQTTDAQNQKHNECRHGTQSRASYAQLQTLTTDLRAVPGTKGSQASVGGELLQIIVSQFGGMRYDRSRMETDPMLKQLLDLMVQTNRRIGGEEFVPHF